MNITPEIEAVARAIYETWRVSEYSHDDEKSVTWDELIQNADEFASFAKYRDLARFEAIAAIRALKYATTGQKEAGGNAADKYYSICEWVEFSDEVAECAYRHMIDAALGEHHDA